MKRNRQQIISWLFASFLIALILFFKSIGLITEYLWLQTLGFESVFMTRVVSKILIFAIGTLLFSGFIWAVGKRYIHHKIIRLGLSVSLAAIFAFVLANSQWLNLLKFLNATSFGKSDPIFNLDIGFYFFTLPMLRPLLFFGITIVLMVIAGRGFYQLHAANNQNIVEDRGLDLTHAFLIPWLYKTYVLWSILFILFGGFLWMRMYHLILTSGKVVFGAGYTDVTIGILAYKVYAFVSILSAVLVILSAKRKKIKLFFIGPMVLLVTMLGFNVTEIVVQKLIVEPNEITKETTYLGYNMSFTRDAYNIGNISSIDFPYEENLTLAKIRANDETIRNIRVNDSRPLLQTYNQIQSIRLYYDFMDIDVDRYIIDEAYTQVFISARELNQQKLDPQAKTWVNENLKFTHGYGVVVSPVNTVTEEGQPLLLMRNIPPVTQSSLNLSRPEIYFGELTNRSVLVNTKEKEFDYPSGQDNVETMYEGKDGVQLNGIKRLIFALNQRSMKLLVSSNITPESRILLNRNIVDRVQKIAPFLVYDANPYIVINQEDGKLYWIIDAYTTSNQYPYSEKSVFKGNEISYIRNSVKVVLDAYEGETSFYIYDTTDPLIRTYASIFPKLFKSKSEFPQGLLPHVRYPLDYFSNQAQILRKYHVQNPVVFYNGEDLWDIADEKYMGNVQKVVPNYVMFKINDKAEFALILPYTPRTKPNMTALLIARNDAPYYGELKLYLMPKDQTIQGPIMIESRIDQDPFISQEFTLWGQQGSTILRGNLIVVPIENSLLYVEPIYLQSDHQNNLPEMKRVIVAYKNEIVMEQTLDLAINRIFGEVPVEEVFNERLSETLEALIMQISDEFENAKNSLDELERLIEGLKDMMK